MKAVRGDLQTIGSKRANGQIKRVKDSKAAT